MTSPDPITEYLLTANRQQREVVDATAETVLAMVQAAGTVSLMANGALPLTGTLLMVNPAVYEAVRRKTKEMEG